MNNRPMPNKTRQIGFLVLVLVLLLGTIYSMTRSTKRESLVYSEVIELFETEQVESFTIDTDGNLTMKLRSAYKGQTTYSYECGSYSIFYNDLNDLVREQKDAGILTEYDYPPAWEAAWWLSFVPYLIIFVIMGVLWYSMMRSAQGGGAGGVMKFSKARTRLGSEEKQKKTFADVAGADEEKEELEEIVEYLKNPSAYTKMGARIPKGVLLVGPPGTGKTLLAKAVAGEAKVPFFSISGSDFVEMFVGVGASRVRDLFTTAKKCAPAVVFIDEIDAVGRQRGAGLGGGHDEREQTLNQLLVEMDGFAVNEGIIVIAATNRPDILDPALLRPGRFDRQITVNYPDVKGREAILKVHAKGKPLAKEVSLEVLAKRTPGFTGADLENVLNEAAILAARYKKKEIGMTELEEAITRTVVGPEKRSHVITPEDKKITAYHEAGHAVVARVLPNCDPVHEISVIPRGRAAGYTMTMPEDDRDHMSRGKILDEIAMALGGRVAESIFLDDICTGAYSDLQKATELARRMVVEFGMSDEIGPVFLGGQTEVFIAKDWGHQRNFSEEVAARVDKEIRRILEEQYDRAKTVLTEHRDAMERIVKALIEYEHIDGDDFEKLFKGEDVELETFSDRRARIEKADEEVLAKEKAEAEAKAAVEAQEQSADGEGENK